MYLYAYKLKNFRRLLDVRIELEQDISIFVGSNNSGKTSATHAVKLFTDCSKDKFSVYDFSAECWTKINKMGTLKETGTDEEIAAISDTFPVISLDLWFSVEANDLNRVIDLLPSLTWQGSYVGIRIEFAPSDLEGLFTRYLEAKTKATKHIIEGGDYHPWPSDLTDYLKENLSHEFELKYYVLDYASFDEELKEKTGYKPLLLTPDKGRGGAQIVKSLLKVDCLDAQRHLSDSSGGRSEDLSRCLSRFYSRNLKQREEDYTIQKALADAKTELDDHLEKVFGPTLSHLSTLGYPGFSNPRLMIRSALNPATIMSSQDGATVHYALESPSGIEKEYTLPDRYNGLGFKNLIYMVIELLDLHAQWLEIEEDRPPLHLIFIEEPEAHLHTQLQQVFIRKILDILKIDASDIGYYFSQLVITTHSPHILFERGFQPIRYFRRGVNNGIQISEVLNLSSFYKNAQKADRDFLERYMKLMHCDLFFADAAILVEGNVERLLMPFMIAQVAEKLKSSYLSIIEIGGAFGYRFKSLIEFLGIKTLIITDIDSVNPIPTGTEEEEENDDEEDDNQEEKSGKACPVNKDSAVTSNQTLIQWLPKKTLISELLAATDAEKTQEPTNNCSAHIRVVYQKPYNVTWAGQSLELTGRTFEEDFAYSNLSWCQNKSKKELGLYISKNNEKTLTDLSTRLFKRVKGSNFNKTDFALALLAELPTDWNVPLYITEGLNWLTKQMVTQEEKVVETTLDIIE